MCLLSVFVVPLLLESLNSSLIDMFSKSFIKVLSKSHPFFGRDLVGHGSFFLNKLYILQD